MAWRVDKLVCSNPLRFDRSNVLDGLAPTFRLVRDKNRRAQVQYQNLLSKEQLKYKHTKVAPFILSTVSGITILVLTWPYVVWLESRYIQEANHVEPPRLGSKKRWRPLFLIQIAAVIIKASIRWLCWRPSIRPRRWCCLDSRN